MKKEESPSWGTPICRNQEEERNQAKENEKESPRDKRTLRL